MKRLSPDPDLDALVRRLNTAAGDASRPASAGSEADGEGAAAEAIPASARPTAAAPRWPLPPPAEGAGERLAALLAEARAAHASDLLLIGGVPPVRRVNGRLERTSAIPLTAADATSLCGSLVPEARRDEVQHASAVDFALTHAAGGRLRCNVHRARNGWAVAIRLLPASISDLAVLGLPEQLDRFADLDYGLVLVTGPTGSGKSTTLAALVKRILARRRVHLITIEDPVEFEHPHGDGVVEHVEVGRDAPGFAHAMRAALRQDPDVLLVGEMRDPESISIAITAAETGHLVLSTLHTGDAPQTVHRVLDSYPPGQIDTVRVQLSISLAGIVSQQLLPRRDGRGRVPAVEILVGTPAVRNLIRRSKIPQLRHQLALERSAGMLSLDDSLAALVRAGLVEADEARRRARSPEDFRVTGPDRDNFSSQST